MIFKVYARTMYVGQLTVTQSGLHLFRNRDNKRSVIDYKKLNLKRVK